MPYVVMALEALRMFITLEPALIASFQALLQLIHPTNGATAVVGLATLTQYWTEALTQVSALKFVSDDPVANSVAQWNSALATVQARADADGLAFDPSAILTAGQIASHKVDFDTPLDVLPSAAGTTVKIVSTAPAA